MSFHTVVEVLCNIYIYVLVARFCHPYHVRKTFMSRQIYLTRKVKMRITFSSECSLFGSVNNFIQNDVLLDFLMALRLKTPRLMKLLLRVDWYVSRDPITFIFGIKNSNA